MGTEDAKTRYQDRAATAEFALAHNLMRMAHLMPEWFDLGTAASATSDMAR